MADPVEEFAAEMDGQIEASQDKEWATYPDWIRRFNKAHQKNFNRIMAANLERRMRELEAAGEFPSFTEWLEKQKD